MQVLYLTLYELYLTMSMSLIPFSFIKFLGVVELHHCWMVLRWIINIACGPELLFKNSLEISYETNQTWFCPNASQVLHYIEIEDSLSRKTDYNVNSHYQVYYNDILLMLYEYPSHYHTNNTNLRHINGMDLLILSCILTVSY